jgi:hypothetical protein
VALFNLEALKEPKGIRKEFGFEEESPIKELY